MEKIRGVSQLLSDTARLTSLSEVDAKRFLRNVYREPFLYVIYNSSGKAVDWDSAPTERVIDQNIFATDFMKLN